MNKQQVHFEPNRENYFTISVKKPPKFIQISLIITILISLLLPIAGMSAMIILRTELKIEILIGFAVFWTVAYFLFRVWTWNANGKENFEFGKEKISYFADFKYFKDSQTQIENNNLTFEFEEIGHIKDNQGLLIIKSGENTLKSVVKVKIPELKETIERLKNYA